MTRNQFWNRVAEAEEDLAGAEEKERLLGL